MTLIEEKVDLVLPITNSMIKLTEKNYDEVTSKGKVVVFITAAFCGHCQASKPAFNILETKLNDTTCGMADVAEEMGIATKLGITNIPVIVVYKDGKELGRTTSVESVDSMQTWVEGLTK